MEGIEEIQWAIDDSDTSIQQELTRTGNSWLECFGTRLQVILLRVERYGGESAEQIRARLDTLRTKFARMKDDMGGDPSQQIKDALLNDLKNLLN